MASWSKRINPTLRVTLLLLSSQNGESKLEVSVEPAVGDQDQALRMPLNLVPANHHDTLGL